jgi:hypothetical protein
VTLAFSVLTYNKRTTLAACSQQATLSKGDSSFLRCTAYTAALASMATRRYGATANNRLTARSRQLGEVSP